MLLPQEDLASVTSACTKPGCTCSTTSSLHDLVRRLVRRLKIVLFEIQRDLVLALDVALGVGLHLELLLESHLELAIGAVQALDDALRSRRLVDHLQAVEQRHVRVSLEHVLADHQAPLLLVEALQAANLLLHLHQAQGLQVLGVHLRKNAAEKRQAAVRRVDVKIQLRRDQQAADGAGHRLLEEEEHVGHRLGALLRLGQAGHPVRLRQVAQQVKHPVAVLEGDDASAVHGGAQRFVVLPHEPAARGVEPQLRDHALGVSIQLELQLPGLRARPQPNHVAVRVLVLHGGPVLEELVQVKVTGIEVERGRPVLLPVRHQRAAAHRQARPAQLRRGRGGRPLLRGRGGRVSRSSPLRGGRRRRLRAHVQGAEEVGRGHDRGVSQRHVELRLGLHLRLEVRESVDDADAGVERRDRKLLRDDDAPLQLLAVQGGDAHGHAVALAGLLNGPLEHLQAPHLLALPSLAQRGHHNGLLRLHRAGEHGARQDRALPLDGKGVVKREHERT
mmetsp:Transcript_63537/g.171447  ORF Transcript_63537/g.171447 Transcript_63537/m.171447 type:complete len:504 (+) Transcript_63537:46-1557(+)